MQNNKRLIFVSSVVLLTAISRIFFAAIPNFSPVAAMALFGGVYLADRKFALIIPLLAMLVSDMVLGFHDLMWAVYLAFAMVVGLGMLIKKVKPLTIAGASIASSLLFFLLTNFGVWASFSFYPSNFAGLMQSYAAGLPFLQNTLAGDLMFSGILFGGFYLAQLKFPKLAKVKA